MPIGVVALLLAAGPLAVLSASAASPGPGSVAGATKRPTANYIFYPPAPDPPRLQFLVSYSDERDLGQRQSKLATFITGAQAPSQPIVKPYGVVMAANQIYFCDTAARSVTVLDLTLKTMRLFQPLGAGKLGTPVNLAVDRDGTQYIADTGRGHVLVFGNDGSYRGTVSSEKGLRPTGVALSEDRIYVADVNRRSIRVHAKSDRQLLFTIPPDRREVPEEEAAKEGGNEKDKARPAKAEPKDADADKEESGAKQEPPRSDPAELFVPVNLAVDAKGLLYVSDTAACRIQVFDRDGKYLRTLGNEGNLPGQFARPKGVAVDPLGRVYVVDAASQVCQIFDGEGRLLIYFGEPNGSAAPLDMPAGIWVDSENIGLFKKYVAPDFVVEQLVIITNQYGDRKISVYGLGHKRA